MSLSFIWLGELCRYKIIKEVGDGTFGSVWRAINKQTGEIVCGALYVYAFFHFYICLFRS